ncbi:hypothetical protein FBU59_000999 [Linderina macrospora]|uniref:Uncharacterized protein n=1 Tax=Linderina macrospora TaxID=4868 RepID=A0ACC1JFI1_9FUNG|nr:hypothetical protein FBU59_000999 [Linderina macrospora]
MSPALPSRPLPQPSSNPFVGRPALPQLPKVPPAPSAAVPPPPAAAPPMLGMTTSLPPLPVRRPSASSVASGSSSVREGSVPLPPLPPVQQLPKTVDEEVSEEEPDLKSADEKKQDEGETTEAATGSNQEEGAEEEGGNDAESTAPTSKPRSDPKLAKIIEDYEATSNEELNLISGDVVTIIHRGTDDEPRWKGEYHGKKGYFPSHVVEAISESAGLDEEHNEDESGDPSESKPKGFKLAAYGVQQGGLGSIFAGGGMPMLRKSATSSKKDDVEDSEDAQAAAPAPAPAPAPMMHKLRSVRRPPPKEEVKEEVPNFLAQLNRAPRKSSPSVKDEEPVPAPAPAPALPRKTLSRSSTFEEPAAAEEPAAVEEPIVEEPAKELPKQQESPAPVAAPEPVAEEEEGEEPEEEESEDEAEEEITPSPAKEQKAVSEEPAEKLAATEDDEEGEAEETQDRELPETTQPKESLDSEPATESPEPAAAAAAEEEEEQPEELPEEPKQPALDPVKAPSLPHVKRLVRRAPRQKPTSEALKKQVEEDSQSKTLQTALEKDKDAPIEESPAKATPPPVAEKPKGLGGRAHFGGPQLPTGGFKATGRVGSAMAERLAALQARASGAMSEESEEPAKSPPSSNENRRSFAAYSPPQPRATTMSPASVTTNIESPSGGEWQRQVEEEQKKLRGDVEKASRAMADVEALAGKLRASEQEQTAQKQTIVALESKLETMARQLSKMQEEAGEARQALARLEANRGVSAEEVTALLKKELQAAVEPLRKQTQDLSNENIKLRDDIKGLKTYIDELVVEEEE